MKFTIKALTLLAFLATTTVGYAQNGALPNDPNVKIGKLPNGLTYYIRKNVKPAKKVELRLAVNAGSVLEDDNQQGLAHFMEHMGFNGSTNFPKNELVSYLQTIGVEFGADLNAYTSFDETVYILPIPSDKPEVVDKGFTVLEDWAFNNLFDAAELDKERGVVLEESRLSKGAFNRLGKTYYPLLFNGSAYSSRLPIGKDSILKTFKRETLIDFYKKWYRPDLMAVVVVGDIEPAEAEKLIVKHFSKFNNPANEVARPSIITINERTSPKAVVLTDDELQSTILQIYNYVKVKKPVTTWAHYREKTVENLMLTMINQRLREVAQQANPPFNGAGIYMNEFIRGYESFYSSASISTGSVNAAVDALIAETERARQYGFLPTELERAKAALLNSAEKQYTERDKSESSEMVAAYVDNFLDGTPIPGVENKYNFTKTTLPGITLAEINDLAKKMPSTANSFAMILAPTAMKSKLPDDAGLLKFITDANGKPVKPYEEKSLATKLLDKEPVAGKVVTTTPNAKLGTTSYTLSNGITITLKPTTLQNDAIKMDAWRLGGIGKLPIADKKQGQYVSTAVKMMGAGSFSGTDLTKFLAGKTVVVSPYINANEEGIEGNCNAGNLETFLQLVHLYITQPRKDETIFKSYVARQSGQVKFLKQNPNFYFQDTVTKVLYNNNPWTNLDLNEATFAALNLDKMLGIYNSTYGNMYGMHFTFVGNIDPAKIKPLLEKYLGSLPAKTKVNTFKDNGARPVKGVINLDVYKGKEAQSIVRLIFTGNAVVSKTEELKLKALLDVINIKITEKLREEMSGIYGGGFNGSLTKRPYPSFAINSYIPCGPENVDKLNTALLALVKSIQKDGIDAKDLAKVKETYYKQYETNIQSNDYWLTNLSEAWINQANPEDILTYEKDVAALTPADIKAAAIKYLNTNNYVKAVLYPEKAN